MRIGGGSATGDAISHSRWPSWCAVLFEKSDTEEEGQRGGSSPNLAKLYNKTSNGPPMVF
jgi:hypothetical protein